MLTQLDFLREMTFGSVVLRLVLAMFFGGVLGIERQTKRRPAGFRTYMLVCLGATLTMLLGQYEYTQLITSWADHAAQIGTKIDVSRFGAQVINGIGFLGAGVILKDGTKVIKVYSNRNNKLHEFDQYIIADNACGILSKLRKEFLTKNINWSDKVPEEFRIQYCDIGAI